MKKNLNNNILPLVFKKKRKIKPTAICKQIFKRCVLYSLIKVRYKDNLPTVLYDLD